MKFLCVTERASLFLGGLCTTRIEPPEHVIETARPSGPEVSIEVWQSELAKTRAASVGNPGLYLDRSETGAGKSTADRAALSLVKKGLVVVQTHEQCREVAEDLRAHGLSAVAYPGRSTKGDDPNC